MTTKPTAPTWPEKVYLTTIHWNDEGKKVPRFMGYKNTIVTNKAPNTVEYVSADIVAAREQEIIRATLDYVYQEMAETGFAHWVARIDPATVLNNMEKK